MGGRITSPGCNPGSTGSLWPVGQFPGVLPRAPVLVPGVPFPRRELTKVQGEKTRASCLDLTRVLQDQVVVLSELLPSQAKITGNRGSRPKRFNFVSKTR